MQAVPPNKGGSVTKHTAQEWTIVALVIIVAAMSLWGMVFLHTELVKTKAESARLAEEYHEVEALLIDLAYRSGDVRMGRDLLGISQEPKEDIIEEVRRRAAEMQSSQ